MDNAHRQAVYYAPSPAHPLWDAGCSWLGRDPARADDLRPPARAQVSEPWRYGFHATLKSPLRVARPQHEWFAAVAAIAASTQRFMMPSLSVDWLGAFIAVKPVGPLDFDHPLQRLADVCVIELDEFRSPPVPHQEPERPSLNERQRDYLQRYDSHAASAVLNLIALIALIASTLQTETRASP